MPGPVHFRLARVLATACLALPCFAVHGAPAEHASVSASVTVDGQRVSYLARPGLLHLTDETGKTVAEVFYVAYTRADAETSGSRPLTFCWNGGPGSASLWLHLGLGPRRVALTDEGRVPAQPWRLEENDETWLKFTDLVFVDAVETGFSRATPAETRERFAGYANDVRANGEFVKKYLSTFRRWTSPVYLAGESYAGARIAGLSEHLQFDSASLRLAGLIFISPGIDFRAVSSTEDSPLPFILLLPSLAATAMHHGRLAPELQADFQRTLREVEDFAINEYPPALLKGRALPESERRRVAERLARYTGLRIEDILSANLRVDAELFRTRLLADQSKILGLYDARYTGFNRVPLASAPAFDPSISEIRSAFATTLRHYLSDDLGFLLDRDYRVSAKVGPWPLNDGNHPLNTGPALARAMTMNPSMKVWIATGYYDLSATYYSTRYVANQLNIAPAARDALQLTTYRSGHMIYLRAEAMRALRKDAESYYARPAPTP